MTTAVIPKLRSLAQTLEQQFLGRQETIRLMVLSVLAGEHIALVGPPGTAKSALVRTFARAIDSRYSISQPRMTAATRSLPGLPRCSHSASAAGTMTAIGCSTPSGWWGCVVEP